jgi:hemolysin III
MTPQPTGRRRITTLTTAGFVEEVKPRLRGWSHGVGAVAALVVSAVLLPAVWPDPLRFWSVFIFCASLVLMYSISALYHLGSWRGRTEHRLLALDHANIYLLIAGSYTPICAIVLDGWLRTAILALVWGMAALGVVSSLLTLHVPRWLLTVLYIAMGWCALFVLPALTAALGLIAVLTLLAAGVIYTLGALVYIFGWPDPLPHFFGFHEVFHLCVVAGSAVTVLVVWVWVLPYGR